MQLLENHRCIGNLIYSVPTAQTSKLTLPSANFECETLNKRIAGAFCNVASILKSRVSVTLHFASVYSRVFRCLLSIIPVDFNRDQKISICLYGKIPFTFTFAFLINDHRSTFDITLFSSRLLLFISREDKGK